MGRTSKFSFPMPGRKHASTTTREDIRPVPNTPTTPSHHHLSKAQRILGTDSNLNIDSPFRETVEDYSWRHVGLKSSGMSISISESTHSTTEDESQSEQWDRESGVFPQDHRVHGKPSSTLLGLKFGEEGAPSSAGLRHNDSSSTLKSYYDRQKSPLSISQQTSASSARDLALRKGFPPVQQRSPLLNVELSIDRFEDNFREKDIYIKEADIMPDKMRKKPAKLDLSKLFPRSRRHGDKSPADLPSSSASPSSLVTNSSRNSSQPPDSGRRKLKKTPSKESMQSQRNSVRTTRSHDPQMRHKDASLPDMYDHYEHLPVRAPHMDRIPEASIPERLAARAKKDGYIQSKLEVPSRSSNTSERHRETSDREPFSWKNVRSSMMVPTYDNSSAASISSRNTRTSRHTATSIRSHSDLKDKSVLSLSSDSEGEMSDPEPIRAPSMTSVTSNTTAQQAQNRTSLRPTDNRRPPSHLPSGLAAKTQSKVSVAERDTNQNLLTIPEKPTRSSHISANWPQPPTDHYDPPERQYRGSIQKAKRTSRQAPSIASMGSHHQPTPPLSPSSMEFRQTPERESRFMAVTKQEEALLEALRQKRARMREEIIEEHETNKTPSPPRVPARSASRYSSTSTTNTIRGGGNPSGKQRVLLYLDTPLSVAEAIDAPEPSPDLSDFLSFGSDENSTPRNSWAPSRSGNSKARPDSFITPYSRGDKYAPSTPPSAARLSAVGAAGGLGNKKRNTGAVRFVDDGKGNNQDYLLDDHESGVIWGM